MSNRRNRSSYAVLATATALLLAAASATAATGHRTDAGGWHRLDLKAPEGGYSNANGVFVSSSTDAWVAGDAGRQGQFRRTAAIEHWDGNSFTVAATPNIPHAQSPAYYGMGGTGPSDVWAVGGYGTKSGDYHSLIEHFDGASWSLVAPPPDEPAGSSLNAVSADSPTDAWAVGDYNEGEGIHPLIEHYDGSSWSVVDGITQPRVLFSVAAVSPTDVWAVGVLNDDTPPIVEHFDGTSWTQVTQALPTRGALNSISALSADDIWAVGEANSDTLVEHWDGTSWSIVDSPNGPTQSGLISVAAVSKHDVWAVGETSYDLQEPLAMHYDGRSWQLSKVPAPGIADQLTDVAAAPGSPVFAAGMTVQPHQPYLQRGLVLEHRP